MPIAVRKAHLLQLSLAIATGPIVVGLGMAPARADPLEDPLPTFEVRYKDLDLTKVSDQVRMKHRLAGAATVLCKEVDNAMPVAAVDPACYRVTLEAAVRQMDKAIAQAHERSAIAVGTAASQHR